MSAGDPKQDDLAASWGAEMGLEEEAPETPDSAEGGDGGGSDGQDDLAAAWGAEMGLDEADGADAGDQDDLAAAWGAEMEGGGEGGEDVAAQWASMVDGGMDANEERKARLLSQGEIDSLLGFQLSDGDDENMSGLRAIVNSGIINYERLPMLEIVFDRLVRLLTTSLRNFTSDNVELTLDSITTIRFGDYLNSIPLPAMLAVFKAEQWDNFGLITVESNLIYSIVDVLLGGRGSSAIRIVGRPYTTIESNLVKRMIEVVLDDAGEAFAPLTEIDFTLDRLETNPRFASVAREQDAAVCVELRIDMEDRGGRIEIILPLSTLEPIRELLLQGFLGEKFGNDSIWEEHLENEIWNTKLPIEIVLAELAMPLQKIMDMKPGDSFMLECSPDQPVSMRSGNIEIATCLMGSRSGRLAVRLESRPSQRRVDSGLIEG